MSRAEGGVIFQGGRFRQRHFAWLVSKAVLIRSAGLKQAAPPPAMRLQQRARSQMPWLMVSPHLMAMVAEVLVVSRAVLYAGW
ncbi:hypothetical protein ECTOBSL9_1780 [Ectothiorhodospira sp. BSL-9]|nr:hypothetical protein ECTOBSL9_1780 [Ectothiorhodospira sp. BSL-9]